MQITSIEQLPCKLLCKIAYEACESPLHKQLLLFNSYISQYEINNKTVDHRLFENSDLPEYFFTKIDACNIFCTSKPIYKLLPEYIHYQRTLLKIPDTIKSQLTIAYESAWLGYFQSKKESKVQVTLPIYKNILFAGFNKSFNKATINAATNLTFSSIQKISHTTHCINIVKNIINQGDGAVIEIINTFFHRYDLTDDLIPLFYPKLNLKVIRALIDDKLHTFKNNSLKFKLILAYNEDFIATLNDSDLRILDTALDSISCIQLIKNNQLCKLICHHIIPIISEKHFNTDLQKYVDILLKSDNYYKDAYKILLEIEGIQCINSNQTTINKHHLFYFSNAAQSTSNMEQLQKFSNLLLKIDESEIDRTTDMYFYKQPTWLLDCDINLAYNIITFKDFIFPSNHNINLSSTFITELNSWAELLSQAYLEKGIRLYIERISPVLQRMFSSSLPDSIKCFIYFGIRCTYSLTYTLIRCFVLLRRKLSQATSTLF